MAILGGLPDGGYIRRPSREGWGPGKEARFPGGSRRQVDTEAYPTELLNRRTKAHGPLKHPNEREEQADTRLLAHR